MNKSFPLKIISNFLILGSIVLLLFIYFPLLKIYLFPSKPESLKNSNFYISIKKLNIISPVIQNVDPISEAVYKEALKKGIAHAKGTSLPGQKGTIFLFAHSSDYPWNISKYNTIFFRLNDLNSGDQIKIVKSGKDYLYIVYDKKIVLPSEVSYLNNTKENRLILQTCWPPGTAFMRLLVFAKPQ